MGFFEKIGDWLIDFEVHHLRGLPRPVPGPLSVPVAPKVEKPKPEKPKDDGWRRAFTVLQGDGKKLFASTVQTRTVFTDDGRMEADVRIAGQSRVALSPDLSDADRVELKARGVSQKAGEFLKPFWVVSPLMSAADLESVNGEYRIRTCEGALAAFRAASGIEPQNQAVAELRR